MKGTKDAHNSTYDLVRHSLFMLSKIDLGKGSLFNRIGMRFEFINYSLSASELPIKF